MELRRDVFDSIESSHVRAVTGYPPELHYIRALFLDKQYRRCITACRDALKFDQTLTTGQPLQSTFIQFYLALAHDELARAMHNFSQAKVLAFQQAEQWYHQALLNLPTAEDCLDSILDFESDTDNRSFCGPEPLLREASSMSILTNSTQRAPSSKCSPSQSKRTDCSDSRDFIRSPPLTTSESTASDLDDVESHDSYNDIMTPSRLPKLQRDYSSMSLLQPSQRPMAHALMRPIRLGSPPKPYHVPPRLPFTTDTRQHRSQLPRLNTTCSDGSPVRKQLRTPSEQASPVCSPVSPLGSEGGTLMSDTSTISPVTPETPDAGALFGMHDTDVAEHPRFQRIYEHLECMRVQLDSHIQLVGEAKQRTLRTQAERAAARAAPHKGGQLTALIDAAGSKSKRTPQSRSYWSFTPRDVKALEKQNRIESGRARGWTRERFQPARYLALADAALAEL